MTGDLEPPTRSAQRRQQELARASGREASRIEAHRSHRRLLLLVLAIVVGVGIAFTVLWNQAESDGLSADEAKQGAASTFDFPGPGAEPVLVAIAGDTTPQQMAEALFTAGVIGSTDAFLTAYSAGSQPVIEPGTYELFREMKAADALAELQISENRADLFVEVKPGLSYSAVIEDLSKMTGVSASDIEAALADTAATGLPAEAGGQYDGWLATGGYFFPLDESPVDMVKAMVGSTITALDGLGVAPGDRQKVLTTASLLELESPLVENRATVASVINNRLAAEMPLSLDSTVRYIVGDVDRALTAADRAVDSLYNTFLHPGLPPSPIATVSTDSIQAAVAPADTSYLYFVVVNPVTFETQFSSTYTEYQKSLKVLTAWVDDNS